MNREKEIVKTSVIGIIGNVFLVAGKIFVGVIARSASIVSDAVNNLTDAMSSIITVVGAKLSGKKPDRKHPYGHGRAEFIAASFIGMLIFVAGALAIYESVLSLINGEKPEYDVYSFIIIGAAVLVKVGLGLYFKKKGEKVKSDSLKASGTDALLDSLLSFGTLVGAGISFAFGVHPEGYIGIAIGLLIIKSSVDVFRESASKILGERTETQFVSEMVKDISENPRVFGVYDLILHNYGADRNIGSVHVEVDERLTAKEIQILEREIAYLCYDKYNTVMTVGVYARNGGNGKENEIRKKVEEITAAYPEILQTHGFFADEKNKTVSLDIIISFECETPEKIYGEVRKKIQDEYPDYTVHIILDKDFSLT